jgi:hypothetical protein
MTIIDELVTVLGLKTEENAAGFFGFGGKA